MRYAKPPRPRPFPHYEDDDTGRFPDGDEDYYRHAEYPGIAFRVLGWETEPDEDTEWTGQEIRTGKLIAIMVGDDRKHRCDPEDMTPLPRAEFCGECGQIGCHCDGYEE